MESVLSQFFSHRNVAKNGNRSVSGKHMDDIENWMCTRLHEKGYITEKHKNVETLYSGTKNWDIVVYKNEIMYAIIELKSINALSQSKNAKNRLIEAIGIYHDVQPTNPNAKVVYVMIIEETKCTPKFVTLLKNLENMYHAVGIAVVNKDEAVSNFETILNIF